MEFTGNPVVDEIIASFVRWQWKEISQLKSKKMSKKDFEDLIDFIENNGWHFKHESINEILSRADVPKTILERCSKSKMDILKFSIINNKNLTQQQALNIAETGYLNTRMRLAWQDKRTEVIKKLSKDRAWEVRREIAINPTTPSWILCQMLMTEKQKIVIVSIKSRLKKEIKK